MKQALLFAFISVGLLFSNSCKNPEKDVIVATMPEGQLIVPDGFSTKGIDRETMQMLLNNGDHIDYIFTSLPLSMNQDGRNAMMQDMRFVSNKAMTGLPANCTPLARKIYLGNGEILLESDIYFSEGCLFQIYIKDEKPLFGNLLSQEGITFYKNLMLEARQSMPENLRQRYTIPSGI